MLAPLRCVSVRTFPASRINPQSLPFVSEAVPNNTSAVEHTYWAFPRAASMMRRAVR